MLNDEFDKYVNKFDMTNYDINYKYHHSYRVCELSDTIASSLNLSDEDKYLAHVIGLLHDIGRFKQLEVYHTMNDIESVDHALYGADLLFKDNLIDSFNIDKKYYNIIDKAIKNHNKLVIEDGLNSQELLQAKIIRDADKIDIYNAFTDLGSYDVTGILGPVSVNVRNSFLNKESIQKKDKKTKADKVLMLLSFIFDINYKESLDIIRKRDYVNKLYNGITNKEDYKEYFDFINNYMEGNDK